MDNAPATASFDSANNDDAKEKNEGNNGASVIDGGSVVGDGGGTSNGQEQDRSGGSPIHLGIMARRLGEEQPSAEVSVGDIHIGDKQPPLPSRYLQKDRLKYLCLQMLSVDN